MELSFTKMQGCANDYIYLDCRKSGVPENIAALSGKIVPAAFFHRGRRHHLHLRCADRRGGRHDAHLQRRWQRGQDVRQRHPLRGRVAVHPRHVQKDRLPLIPSAA